MYEILFFLPDLFIIDGDDHESLPRDEAVLVLCQGEKGSLHSSADLLRVQRMEKLQWLLSPGI